MILFIVIILASVVILYQSLNTREDFSDIKLKYINHSEDEQDSYPKIFKHKYPKSIYRLNYLKGQMLDIRFPNLVQHRYDYNDQRLCDTKPVLKDVARLKELPLHLRNWYHAKIPKYHSMTDDYYWPDTIIGNKYEGECKTKPIKILKAPRLKRIVNGFDPTSLLPSQYAGKSYLLKK